MTVYELIQKLTEFPAEADVKVNIYGTSKQVETYVQDAVDDWLRLERDIITLNGHVEDVDWKFYGESIELNCEVDDL